MKISNSVWNSHPSLQSKRSFSNLFLYSTAQYSCKNWKNSRSIRHRLHVFQQRCLRKMLKKSRSPTWISSEMRFCGNARCYPFPAQLEGHLLRLDSSCIAATAQKWVLKDEGESVTVPDERRRICILRTVFY